MVLGFLALGSLGWAGRNALVKSDDLLRRAEEVGRFTKRIDPYRNQDNTYPPTALPVFTALIAPFGRELALKAAWLFLNLGALGGTCGLLVHLWGRAWPRGLQVAFVFVVCASKPVRLGIGLGQFHLLPFMLMLLAMAAIKTRRPALAGGFVGIALAKPTMALPFLAYLSARRQWVALMTAAGVQAACLAGASAWLGIGPQRLLREWLHWARLQQAAGLIDVPSLLQVIAPEAGALAMPLSAGILLGSALLMERVRSRPDLELFSLATLAAALFAYHRPYDLVLLVPAYLLVVDDAWRARAEDRVRRGLAVVYGTLLIMPEDPFARSGLGLAYDLVFVALAYVLVAVTFMRLRRDPRGP
jgi:hypothetical protein